MVRSGGSCRKIGILLTSRLTFVTVFRKLAARPARGRATIGAFAILAKRNGGQVIENIRFREIPHFAPPMISMTYDQGAKPLVSLCEMILSLLLVFRLVAKQNAMAAKSTRGQNERPRFTPTLRAAVTIDAQASLDSGTPLTARFARAARSGSPGVMIASPGMAFVSRNQSR